MAIGARVSVGARNVTSAGVMNGILLHMEVSSPMAGVAMCEGLRMNS